MGSILQVEVFIIRNNLVLSKKTVNHGDVGRVLWCRNEGTVTGLNGEAGGIVGKYENGGINNCINTGAVTGSTAGGMVATVSSSTGVPLTICVNTGAIMTLPNDTAGGALIGSGSAREIKQCYWLEGSASKRLTASVSSANPFGGCS